MWRNLEHLFSICFYIKTKPIITKSQKESMKLDFFSLTNFCKCSSHEREKEINEIVKVT